MYLIKVWSPSNQSVNQKRAITRHNLNTEEQELFGENYLQRIIEKTYHDFPESQNTEALRIASNQIHQTVILACLQLCAHPYTT